MLIDLSRVPPPDIVERLDHETIRADLIQEFRARHPAFDAVLESDPAIKLIGVAAYRELLLRARINDAAHAGLLATASGHDLDALAVRYDTERHPGESDTAFRGRVHLAYHAVAAAGSRERFIYHALSADPLVLDADAWSPAIGHVEVAVLARVTAPQAEVDEVDATIGAALFGPPPSGQAYRIAQSADPVLVRVRERVLGDAVAPLGADIRITPADVHHYTLVGELVIPPGPDPATVDALARARLAERLPALQRFRVDLHRAALIEALLVDGVRNVELTEPAADVPRGPGELAVCVGVDLTVTVRDD